MNEATEAAAGRTAGATASGGVSGAAGGAADKVLRVLEAVAVPGGPHRLADITLRAGIPKSSAHRLAVVLTGEGYLVTHGNGLYGVGPALRAFAAQVIADGHDGVHEMLVDLQRLVGGQTVHLAVRSGDHAVYIHKIDAGGPYQMASRVGMHMPLHSTSIGKAILSQLSAEEVDEIIVRAGLPARTPQTITTRTGLHAELEIVRTRGFAYDDEENEPTIRCVAVPVRSKDNKLLGGLSISTVTHNTPAEELDGFVPHLLAFAPRIATTLA
jgi:IclR family transcriptional regulator, acetate operon repressor